MSRLENNQIANLSKVGGSLPNLAMSQRFAWIICFVAVALSALVRFYHIGIQPLWLDEGFSWWDARQSLSDLWNLVPQCDPHPPLYFLTLKVWIAEFGDSSGALRAMSALLGVITTLVIFLAGREINTRVGSLAAVMFALTPFQIDYGREARPYALLCFAMSLLLFAVLRIISSLKAARSTAKESSVSSGEISNRTAWTLLIAAAAILLWTNDAAILVLVSLALIFIVFLVFDQSTHVLFRPMSFAIMCIALLWLPYLPKLVQQTSGVINDFWIPRPNAWYVKDTLRSLISLSSADAFWFAVFALLGGCVLLWRRSDWRQSVLLGGLLLLPVALNLVISESIRSIFLSRTLIVIAPSVVILLACAVVFIASRPLRQLALLTMVGAHALAVYGWLGSDQSNEPWDRIAKEIVAQTGAEFDADRSSNAIVLLAANQLALPLSHALEELHASIPLQGAPTDFPAPSLNALYPSGKCAPSLKDQDLSLIARRINAYRTVYFITRTKNIYDPADAVDKMLQSAGFKQSFAESFAPGSLEVHKFVATAIKHGADSLSPLLKSPAILAR